MIRESSSQQLRQHLGEVLTGVQRSGSPCIITRGGKPVAALVDIEQFERMQRLDAEFERGCSELSAAFSNLSEQEGCGLIDEAVQQARQTPSGGKPRE